MDKPDLYVLSRFLGVLYSNGGPMKKTNIQTSIGLSYPRFTEYLEWMEAHDLVHKSVNSEGSELIDLSPKGLDLYIRLFEWIRDALRGPE
jgi:predicted transcriptional regulator